MNDWRVAFLSAAGFLFLLASMFVLALPDTYEGGIVYAFDPAHAIRFVDAVGLSLMVLGGTLAWGAGMLWRRRVNE
jgi:hypothetical protein